LAFVILDRKHWNRAGGLEMSTMMIGVLAMGILPSDPPNLPAKYRHVIVFRYHPGLLETNREERRQDERQIWKAIKDLEIGYREEGGLGRGFEVSLSAKDLSRWKAAIDKLIEDNVLQYYRWGTDNNGYGLVPVR
jgi:hypothetical protein